MQIDYVNKSPSRKTIWFTNTKYKDYYLKLNSKLMVVKVWNRVANNHIYQLEEE